jgi:hypothetical protein
VAEHRHQGGRGARLGLLTARSRAAKHTSARVPPSVASAGPEIEPTAVSDIIRPNPSRCWSSRRRSRTEGRRSNGTHTWPQPPDTLDVGRTLPYPAVRIQPRKDGPSSWPSWSGVIGKRSRICSFADRCIILPLIPASRLGRPREVDVREVLDTIFSQVKSG